MSRNSKRIIGTAFCITGAALAILGLTASDARATKPSTNTSLALSDKKSDTLEPSERSRVLQSASQSASQSQAQIQLDMATLHAATLSKARSARDSLDAPYLLVTMLGPGDMQTSRQMPAANQHWSIRQDEAKGAAPLTSVVVQPGDSVRVLFTLLEGERVDAANEAAVGVALTKLNRNAVKDASAVAPALAALTSRGASWLGSATMLLTNEGGKTYWRALDCVSTCKVSNSPVKASGATELSATASAGVLELNGNAATYHLQVTAKRAM